MNMMLDLMLCREHQEDIRKSSICILGTKTRETMNESRISRAVVVTTSSSTIWGHIGLNVSVQFLKGTM
jgi:hypothetical protein